MTHLITLAVFEFFYLVYYFTPFFVLLAVGNWVHSWAGESAAFYLVVRYGRPPLAILGFVAFVLSGYRAHLAAEAYGDRGTSLWGAHCLSGTMLRAQLAALPIVGRFFERRTANSEDGDRR